MPKTIKCARCGTTFQANTCGKYCPDCRDTANKEIKKLTEQRLREKRKAEGKTMYVADIDTPEQINLCLNCKKKNCKGFCRDVREVKSKCN
jgi:threonine synthase